MTTQITINNETSYSQEISGINSVSFNYLGNKVYSANKLEKIYGIFVSTPIIASSTFLKWNQLYWEGNKPAGTEIYIYLRSATSQEALDIANWYGPYLDEITDIKDIGLGEYLQFLIVLKSNCVFVPRIDLINVEYMSSDEAVRFFTKAFEVNLVPQHILLTYKSTNTDDDVIRFAISGSDTTDLSGYQYIDPNKIEKLTDLSFESKYVKLMVEIVSASNVPAVVHEFAVIFSGEEDKVERINKKYMESSSSSSSTSSSSSVSSSSSSIDSSSSSSSVSSSSSSYDSSSSTSSSSSIDSSSHTSSSSIDSSSSSYKENWSSSSDSESTVSSASTSSSTSTSSESSSSTTSSGD